MPDLRDIQRALQRRLLNDEEDIRELVVGTPRFPVDTRIGIYAEAYRLRLLEALGDAYPAVHTLLGDVGFERLAHAYLEAHPSRYRSIRWFGDELAGFLERHAPWREQPVLGEMARFEWALRGAFDAPDFVPLGLDALRDVAADDWSGLRLDFNPTIQPLCVFHWNTPRLWQAIDADEDPIPPEPQPDPSNWLVWRNGTQQTLYRSLWVDEAWALHRMRAGDDFATICAGLGEWLDEAAIPERAAGFLAQWLNDDLVTAAHPG